MADAQAILQHVKDYLICLSFSPDGNYIATCGKGRSILLWDVHLGKLKKTFGKHGGKVRSLCWSPDGSLLASGSDDTVIKIFDVSFGSQSGQDLLGHNASVNSVAFSACGRFASGSGDGLRSDNSVRMWCPKSHTCVIGPLHGHESAVRSVLFAPNGDMLASCSDDGAVVLWSTVDGSRLREISGIGHAVCSVTFSPDSRRLAIGSWDKLVRVWDLCGHEFRDGGGGCMEFTGHGSPVTCVRFSPGGARLASASWDGTLRIWDPAAGRPAAGPLLGHTGGVRALGWSPGGAALASAGDDGAVRLWDPATGRPLGARLAGHAGEVWWLGFAPGGSVLATADRDGAVRVWDLLRAPARLALAMAAHPRLGRASPLAALEPGLLAAVAAHLVLVD